MYRFSVSGRRGGGARGRGRLPILDHVLERDQDGHHDRLRFRPIEVHTVLVMEGKQLLPDHGDNAAVRIVKLEVQPQDVAPELPAQALDVGDVLDDVEKLVGQLKGRSVRHGDEMPLMEGEELALDVGHLRAGSVGNVRFIVERGKLGARLIHDLLVFVHDADAVMQGENLRRRKQGTDRLPKLSHVVHIGLLPRLAKPMMLGKDPHVVAS